MKIEGYIEVTIARQSKGRHTLNQLIEAIRRTRLTIDDQVQVDITTPARSEKSGKVIIGMSERPWKPATGHTTDAISSNC